MMVSKNWHVLGGVVALSIFLFAAGILFHAHQALAQYDDQPPLSEQIESCCDEDCYEGLCKGAIAFIYDDCDFVLALDGQRLTREQATQHCIEVDDGCLPNQRPYASGCSGYHCYEGELSVGACDDNIRTPGQVCNSAKGNINSHCIASCSEDELDDSEDGNICG